MTHHQQAGQVVARRYRLERPLARGGMGSVWVAHDLALDVDVAMKFMTPQAAASPGAKSRFEREAKAAAKLRSAHIVQVTDYGVEQETLFLAMELLRGEDLGARLQRYGRLPLSAVVGILSPVCKGLALAHDAGIVHRDLKPANIFLAREGEDEIPKILDFGIAKATSTATTAGGETKTGAIIGSPHFMSPEQIVDSKSVDWRTDIWALGVIAFRCLTGRDAFPGTEIGQVLVSVCSGPLPTPSHVAPDLGPHLDRFFETALARAREQRFQRATDFARALSSLAEWQSRSVVVSSQPPSMPAVAFGQPPTTPLPGYPVDALSAAVPSSGLQLGEPITGLAAALPKRPAVGRKRLGVILGTLAVLVSALAVGGHLATRSTKRVLPQEATTSIPSAESFTAMVPSSAAPTRNTGSPTEPPTPEPSAAPNPVEVLPTGSSTAVVSARPSAAPPQRPPSAPKPVVSASRKPDCDPNYTLDSNGRKRFKPECF